MWNVPAAAFTAVQCQRNYDDLESVSPIAPSRFQGILSPSSAGASPDRISRLGQLHALCRIHSICADAAVRVSTVMIETFRPLPDRHIRLLPGLFKKRF